MAKTKAPKKPKFDKAYQKAVEEIDKDRVTEIKIMLKATLESVFERQRKRAELDKEIKFLQADLEDLKRGKLDKIKERREKDSKLAAISKIDVPKLETWNNTVYLRRPLSSADPFISNNVATFTTATGIDLNGGTNLADLVNTALNS